LFRLAALRSDLGSGSAAPVLVGGSAWSERDGLAFSVRAGDQLGVFVRTPEGTIVEALQEPYANTFRTPRLAWRPGGGTLAIADDVGPGGSVLRLFDPSADSLRTIALDPLGFAGMAWSPDGGTIAVLTGSSALLVVDPSGRWIVRVKTDWKGLIAWTS
jgi:WD40 repeat protein